jgi:polyisoprenoid-binding protein YceI
MATRMLPESSNAIQGGSILMRLSALTLCAAIAAAPLTAQERGIDTQRSTFVIHVGKSGLLSAAAHDHTIEAAIASGAIREAPAPHIEFTIETAKMTLRPDPKVDPKTELTIQKDMEEMTLETMKFPAITFRSSRVEKLADGDWKVEGDLSLHGVAKTVSLTVKLTEGVYTAHTVLKQTDFGIKPIGIGGGMIRVKNEVEIDFRILEQPY